MFAYERKGVKPWITSFYTVRLLESYRWMFLANILSLGYACISGGALGQLDKPRTHPANHNHVEVDSHMYSLVSRVGVE